MFRLVAIANFALSALFGGVGCANESHPTGHTSLPTPESSPADSTRGHVASLLERVPTDIEGRTLVWPPPDDAGPTVLIFISRVCPIANGYAPEINRIVEQYTAQGAAFWLVYPEPGITVDQVRTHAEDYGYACILIADPEQSLTHAVGATITPEAFVVLPGGGIAYQGRIDDLYADLGVRRVAARETELRDALDALLAGRPVPVALSQAVGCIIEAPLPEPADR